jgi:hypothetical protein
MLLVPLHKMSMPLSSITLVNVERVPLSLCCSGGTALNLNFIECPFQCDVCPWEANLSRRSAELINARVSDIIELIHKYHPDVVMLHGGEHYASKEVIQILKEVRNNYSGIIGIKANISRIIYMERHFKELLQYIDLILIEFVDTTLRQDIYKDMQSILDFLQAIATRKYVEIVAIATSINGVESLTNTITTLKDLLTSFLIPVNWIFLKPISLSHKLNTLNKIRNFNIITQAPFESSIEIASTLCISCKNPIIVRQGGHLIKLSINYDGTCKYCGRKYKGFKYPKKLIRIPLEIQVL